MTRCASSSPYRTPTAVALLFLFLSLCFAAVRGLSVSRLERLCRASSLSYLPSTDAVRAARDTSLARLTPLTQIVEPATQSGATIFSAEDEKDGKEGGELVVAFRGSATPKNFATNFRFGLEPLSDQFESEARAHEGFQEAAEGLWERIEPELRRIKREKGRGDETKMTFTGHSLGGGTAQLCSLHAAASTSMFSSSDGSLPLSELVTFGGPITGDSAFAEYVTDRALSGVPVTHIVHDRDPVLVGNGPLWERLGFERAGDVVHCDPYSPRLLSPEEVGGSVVGMGAVYLPAWNILDHCKYLGVYVGPRIW